MDKDLTEKARVEAEKEKLKIKPVPFEIGPSEGNKGAIIRWGKYKDNGVWLLRWKFRDLWSWKFYWKDGWVRLWCFDIHWRNR